MKYSTKPLKPLNSSMFPFAEKQVHIVDRTPLQQQRDADGTQYSRVRPIAQKGMFDFGDKVVKGSLAQNLKDYHHPPDTDPCMTVLTYINSNRAKKEYNTSYSSVYNSPYKNGYTKISDQPRDPLTNRRIVAKPPRADMMTKPAPRNLYEPVKKSMDAIMDRLSKLRE